MPEKMKIPVYSSLGNIYAVVDPKDLGSGELAPQEIIDICGGKNSGIKTDGVLLGPIYEDPGEKIPFVRIFNPDGGEAEKSGNGTRIFAEYLKDSKISIEDKITMKTVGGIVTATFLSDGKIKVSLGKASFWSDEIPVTGERREVLMEKINVLDRDFIFNACTVGNPHCVIILDEISEGLAKKYGSEIENHSIFPKRINVQFVKIIDRNNLNIEIWERGAGYTLSSGSSSCAVAAVTKKLGLIENNILAHMPGGTAEIEVNDNYEVYTSAPVEKLN